jgi:polar amino acid transport system substrate-binding protein
MFLQAKCWKFKPTTSWGLNLVLMLMFQVVLSSDILAAESRPTFPRFRHLDQTSVQSRPPVATAVMAADADFAPWSFVGEDGSLAGISVEIARAACAEAGLTCDLRALAFPDLLPSLSGPEIKAVLSGVRIDQQRQNQYLFTRPYFQSLGRFVVRTGSPLGAPDIRTLAGRRLGYVADSAHGRFVEQFYPRSALTPFKTYQEALEALRTGQVDVAFGDAVQLAFWLEGDASRSCCAFLGKAFLHRETFSRSLFFTVAKEDVALRDQLDAALDKLESKGVIAAIFARYLPGSVW